MPRNISFTKKEALLASYAIAGLLAITVSIGAGCACAFCAYVVVTA